MYIPNGRWKESKDNQSIDLVSFMVEGLAKSGVQRQDISTILKVDGVKTKNILIVIGIMYNFQELVFIPIIFISPFKK